MQNVRIFGVSPFFTGDINEKVIIQLRLWCVQCGDLVSPSTRPREFGLSIECHVTVVDKPSNRPASEMFGTRADSSSYNASECGRETKWESERVSQTDWVAKAKEAIYTIFRINRYTHTYSSSLSGNLLSEVPALRVYNLALHLH